MHLSLVVSLHADGSFSLNPFKAFWYRPLLKWRSILLLSTWILYSYRFFNVITTLAERRFEITFDCMLCRKVPVSVVYTKNVVI